jgi:hypothetical protein
MMQVNVLVHSDGRHADTASKTSPAIVAPLIHRETALLMEEIFALRSRVELLELVERGTQRYANRLEERLAAYEGAEGVNGRWWLRWFRL